MIRKLLVPACLCFVTLAPASGGDPNATVPDLAGAPAREQKNKRLASLEASRERSESSAASVVVPIPELKAPESKAPDGLESGIVSLEAATPLPVAEAIPLPKSRPEPKPVVWRTHEEICETLTKAAAANELPIPFFIRLLFQESGFHPAVVSHAGAQGIAQFMPQTAADMGLDNPFDPLQAIPASARLLRNLFQQFGNFGLAAAAYNAGPKRIQDWLSKKGGLPEETQGYVKVITGREAENFRAGKRGDLAITVPKRAPCQEAAKVYAANQVPIPVAAPGRPQKTVHIAAKEKPAKANTKVASGKTPAAAEKKGALQLAARKNVKGKMRLSSAK